MAFKKATIKEIKPLTENVIELVLQPNEPAEYQAGQFVSLVIPDENGKVQMRSYSIANHFADRKAGILRFTIKLLEGGVASEYLKNVKNGYEIEFIGPSGRFGFKSEDVDHIYAVCTGTGIAPLITIVEEVLKTKPERKITFYIGNRQDKDLFWLDTLDALKDTYKNFDYSITLSQPSPEWKGNTGYVTTTIVNDDIDWKGGHFYMCGIPIMIDDMRTLLSEKGVPEDHVFFERFTSPGRCSSEIEKK